MSHETAVDLFARVQLRLQNWSNDRLALNGFALLIGDDKSLASRRRDHARSVLAAQILLDRLATRDSEPIVLMKGLEVAQLYPTVLARPFRDVDVLLHNPRPAWDGLVAAGYRSDPTRRADIDHHHLPALVDPTGTVGLELHVRPNVPMWGPIPTALLLETAEPSRTGIDGVMRPRDDLHALLLALHCWKGGFTRLRDLLDALLLAEVSERPVEEVARVLNLARFWQTTKGLAAHVLLGESTRVTNLVAGALIKPDQSFQDRKRTRILAPFLVANPIRVCSAHVSEYRLGREARRPGRATPSG